MNKKNIAQNKRTRLIGGGRLRLRLRRARPYRREDNVVPVTDENLVYKIKKVIY